MSHYAEHGNFDAIRRKQGEAAHETFTCLPDERLHEVHTKLAEGRYAHYVD